MGARGSHEASRDSGSHVHLSASYEPLVRAELEAVDAEDISPSRGAKDTDVWLTEWQVGDDGFDVALGGHVDWALIPMDQGWASRLFAGRRTVLLQRDTEAGARGHRTDWTYRSGRVVRIDQVSVRYRPAQAQAPAERGLVPETGGAMQHSVRSLRTPRTHHGRIVGWIVRLRG
ncbi:DUF6578 domain-containing protein [Cryobacterium sp. TMB3-1-2]